MQVFAYVVGTLPWQEALYFVGMVNDGDFQSSHPTGNAGYSDWRLPNLAEFMSLMNAGHATPPPISNSMGTGQWTADDPFTNVQTGSTYWTSTNYAGNSTYAMKAYFYNNSLIYSQKTNDGFVWPVRGGN